MKFGTTIVDPPWPYQRTSLMGKEGSLTGYSDQKYEPLSIAELAALPVGDITTNVLFLWTTAPMIREALRLVDAWGFQYVTQMFWLKAALGSPQMFWNEDGYLLEGDPIEGFAFRAKPSYGVGYWVRGNVEPVVIAKKPGTPSFRTNHPATFVTRRGEHSEKPDTLHALAEDRMPGPFLELFARRPRPGWCQLGNELEGDRGDIRESLPALLMSEDGVAA